MEQVNCSNCMVCAFKDNLCTSEICDRLRKRGNCEDFEGLLMNSIKRGRWIEEPEGFMCSVCYDAWSTEDEKMIKEFNYCPNCGAKMEEEEL